MNYDMQAKQTAYQAETAQAANYPIGYQGVGLAAANSVQKAVIADAMLRELSMLIEKASMVRNRQSNLKDRIFGAPPTCPSGAEKAEIAPQGFLHEANHKLQMLNVIMDGIIQNQTELERLA